MKIKTALVIEVLKYIVKEVIGFVFKEHVGKIEYLTASLAAIYMYKWVPLSWCTGMCDLHFFNMTLKLIFSNVCVEDLKTSY